MEKVTSEQLVVGRTYYANNDRTTPLTFVKYDEDSGHPDFKQQENGRFVEHEDGIVGFLKSDTFYEIPQEPALTLQEKFEQGWEMRYKADHSRVGDLHTMKNGQICVIYESGAGSIYPDLESFENFHTITPPAPKVERRFTPVNCKDGVIAVGLDLDTFDEAKANMTTCSTCILEHEKQGDKWVFVKAHTI